MTSRALNLEPANDATALSAIAAFIRFLSRRRIQNSVISDGAHCFIGTQEWLKKTNQEHQLKNSTTIHELEKFIRHKGIRWSRSLPEGPHHNGSAEAAVKIVKRLLLQSIGQQLLTMAELITLLCEVESIAKAPPLGGMISGSELKMITPFHLIIGRERLTSVAEVPTCLRESAQCRLCLVQTLRNEF
jgi:hypothetical protein